MVCKMCDKQAPDSELRTVKGSMIVAAARRGFIPSKLEASLWIPREDVWARFVRLAESNPSHEFDVCRTCYSEVTRA